MRSWYFTTLLIIDPSVAPSTGTPVRGGLTFREGHFICEAAWETGNVVAVDIVEVNPLLGIDADANAATVQIGWVHLMIIIDVPLQEHHWERRCYNNRNIHCLVFSSSLTIVL